MGALEEVELERGRRTTNGMIDARFLVRLFEAEKSVVTATQQRSNGQSLVLLHFLS